MLISKIRNEQMSARMSNFETIGEILLFWTDFLAHRKLRSAMRRYLNKNDRHHGFRSLPPPLLSVAAMVGNTVLYTFLESSYREEHICYGDISR
jgi:hypothetical protein